MASIRIICYTLEGLIGVGKSTLIKQMELEFCSKEKATNPNVEYLFISEPIEDWTKSNMLSQFYTKTIDFAFTFQSFISFSLFNRELDLFNAISNIIDLRPEVKTIIILKERCLSSSDNFFVPILMQRGYLTQAEGYILLKNSHALQQCLPIKPGWRLESHFIYLKGNVNICLERIKERGRSGEHTIDPGYLNQLKDYMDTYFESHKPIASFDAEVPHLGLCIKEFLKEKIA